MTTWFKTSNEGHELVLKFDAVPVKDDAFINVFIFCNSIDAYDMVSRDAKDIMAAASGALAELIDEEPVLWHDADPRVQVTVLIKEQPEVKNDNNT